MRTNTNFKSEGWAQFWVGEYADEKDNGTPDGRKFGGWIGVTKDGGAHDGNKHEPKAGPGSKYVDYGSIINWFRGSGVMPNKYFATGVTSAGAANKRDQHGYTPDPTSRTNWTQRFKYCKDCGKYYNKNNEPVDDKPVGGQSVDTIEYNDH